MVYLCETIAESKIKKTMKKIVSIVPQPQHQPIQFMLGDTMIVS